MTEPFKPFNIFSNTVHFFTYHRFYAGLFLAVLTLLFWGNDLIKTDGTIISSVHSDTASLFVHWRDFGFNQLRNGHLALWNPHLFSGAPFFGGFESALLYPLNWIYFILPLPNAINISIALHFFLLGFCMYLWTSFRDLHPLACLLAAVLIMFSSPSVMHIFGGHLIDICTMAWAPLLFLIIDRLFHQPSRNLYFLGILTIAMQILGGHPQYMFYTGISVMLYCSLRLIEKTHRWPLLFIVPVIYAGACVLCAVQFFTAADAAQEGIRSIGVSYRFASSFSFPPENFLTILSPFFFGDVEKVPYWGRCNLLAMTLFIGITGFVLMIRGAVYGRKQIRCFSFAMFILLIILALGGHAPLFRFLYDYVPGFNLFRGASKFIFPAALFGVMLAAIGLDDLIKQPRSLGKTILFLSLSGVVVGCAAFVLSPSFCNTLSMPVWETMTRFIASTRESYLPSLLYQDPRFIRKAACFAALSLVRPAALFFLLAGLFYLLKHSERIVYVIVLVGIAEMLSFAATMRTTFNIRDTYSSQFINLPQKQPGDFRVLNLMHPNSAMATGTYDIWGYDPGVLRRYAEFISFTQGYDPDKATNYVEFNRYHPLYEMLRLRFILYPEGNQWRVQEYPDVMPRLNLISNFEVIHNRDDIFRRMKNPEFNPRRMVILEKAPSFPPTSVGSPGICRFWDTSTDQLTIQATTRTNCILLITDNYSRGWHAAGLRGSKERHYEVMPANYTLMAIPLSPGQHLIKLTYRPTAFLVGMSLTVFCLCLCLVYICWMLSKRLVKIRPKSGQAP